jgi:hypothetical protein
MVPAERLDGVEPFPPLSKRLDGVELFPAPAGCTMADPRGNVR